MYAVKCLVLISEVLENTEYSELKAYKKTEL